MAFPLPPNKLSVSLCPTSGWNIRALSKFHYSFLSNRIYANEATIRLSALPAHFSKTVTLSRNFPPGYRYFGNRRSRAVITFTPSYKLLYARYVSADDTRATRDPLSSCEISRSRPCDNYPRGKKNHHRSFQLDYA